MHFEHVIEPGPVVNSPAPHVEHVRLFGFGATVFFAQGKQEANPAASATVPGWQGRQYTEPFPVCANPLGHSRQVEAIDAATSIEKRPEAHKAQSLSATARGIVE